ncbi:MULTISPECIES: AAA family ATPase [unclassified Plantibacter]|uniref:AAA family ATPase n=1 Tax=unclassified Plantibacter TaxID=2624265 RepID=UPI00178755BF|nr:MULTISPECIES: AAA family ATPase [unclassified Plantibacter]MBD8104177.1 AAA family ATPase [Plantibacter sp. CFBP 8775]MBD8517653.1 AAA family ATPase [Plantibacter sp. CFBP 8804]
MIQTLAISGYRSIRDTVLPLHGLDVVTGANGTGKSNLYRALRLLASAGDGDVVGSLARDGGLSSTLWAGPEHVSRAMVDGSVPVQGTRRTGPISLRLGFATDTLGYLIDLGIPQPSTTLFGRDPEIKREQIFAGALAKPSSLLVDRHGPAVRVRDGSWRPIGRTLGTAESILTEFSDADATPEVLRVRGQVRGWRFYDQFRTDRDAPARAPQVGTRTPVLGHDGADLAAAVQTIIESGGRDRLDTAVDDAFPGSVLRVRADDGVFRLELEQPGMLRPLSAGELSDGTLRYLLLVAALLTPRPPELMVLNEPETSLHGDLLPQLARLITAASADTQLVVVSHARPLIEAMLEAGEVHEHRLVKRLGETTVEDQGLLSTPPWAWPSR